MIEEKLWQFTELAQAHGIKVILCSVTPIADYGRAKMSEGRPPRRHFEDQYVDEGVRGESWSDLLRLFQRARRRKRGTEARHFHGRTASQRCWL